MLNNPIFGDLTYDFGFERKITISLFNQDLCISLLLTAYSLDDKITSQQEEAYRQFQIEHKSLLNSVEKLLLQVFGSCFQKKFDLTTLLIGRDGELALLFDDLQNLDEGIAVQMLPTLAISKQSDYL